MLDRMEFGRFLCMQRRGLLQRCGHDRLLLVVAQLALAATLLELPVDDGHSRKLTHTWIECWKKEKTAQCGRALSKVTGKLILGSARAKCN